MQFDVAVVEKTINNSSDSSNRVVLPCAMFKVYGTSNSETWVSKLSLSFPDGVHVQFLPRKLVFTIIPIALEDSIKHNNILHQNFF